MKPVSVRLKTLISVLSLTGFTFMNVVPANSATAQLPMIVRVSEIMPDEDMRVQDAEVAVIWSGDSERIATEFVNEDGEAVFLVPRNFRDGHVIDVAVVVRTWPSDPDPENPEKPRLKKEFTLNYQFGTICNVRMTLPNVGTLNLIPQ